MLWAQTMEKFNTELHSVVSNVTGSIMEREHKGELKPSDITLALSGSSVKQVVKQSNSLPISLTALSKKIKWTNLNILIHIISLITDNSGVSMYEERAVIGEYLTNIIKYYSKSDSTTLSGLPKFQNNNNYDDLEQLYFAAMQTYDSLLSGQHESKTLHDEFNTVDEDHNSGTDLDFVSETPPQCSTRDLDPGQSLYDEYLPWPFGIQESCSNAHFQSICCLPAIPNVTGIYPDPKSTFVDSFYGTQSQPTLYENNHLLVQPFLNEFELRAPYTEHQKIPVWEKNFNSSQVRNRLKHCHFMPTHVVNSLDIEKLNGFNVPVVQIFDASQHEETSVTDMNITRLILSLSFCADQFQKAQIPLEGIVPSSYVNTEESKKELIISEDEFLSFSHSRSSRRLSCYNEFVHYLYCEHLYRHSHQIF